MRQARSPDRSFPGRALRSSWIRWCAGTLFLVVVSTWAAGPPPSPALILDRATGVPGLAPGDTVSAWRRLGSGGRAVAGGPLDGPFGLLGVLRDQLPRGGLELRRGDGWIDLPAQGFDLQAEPVLSGEPRAGDLRAAYRRALGAARSEDGAERRRGFAGLERKAKLFFGTDVTEERLVEQASSARRLHLACHAVVDPRLPLESGLVLAPSGGSGERGNGFLQVWEIYQRVRLDADLVTLSACDTALGRDLPGEGVLGLTRAFQYAGARTVVSSLWKVSDEPSAQLMVRFYRHLLAGSGKAEALRRAQLEMWRGDGEAPGRPATRSPFYWASFQVYGAWDRRR